jgi:hypothetical protein
MKKQTIAPEKNSKSKSIFANPNICKMFSPGEHFQPYQLFYEINGEIPHRVSFYGADNDRLFQTIILKYKVDMTHVITKRFYCNDKKQITFSGFLIPITKDLWLFYGDSENEGRGTNILHTSTVKESEIVELQKIILEYKQERCTLGKIHLLQKFDYGYDLKAYAVSETNCDIKTHYNDDFEEFDLRITRQLNTENIKGLVLLHGKPGTGKTSYIRHLTKKVNKKMIFLSPEVSQQISSPEFISTLSEYPNSIIIIEDAENVIKTRKSGGSSAISNLLNLTDGLLADCLKIQLICSFNTDVSQIDKALLRKGRLIAMYEFNELKQQKANSLALSLGKEIIINSDATLADIFNLEETGVQQEVSAKIGY